MSRGKEWIDFDELRDSVSWERAVQLLDMTHRVLSSGQIRCGCPQHPDDDNRRLLITPEKGFFCGKGNEGGKDVIGLATHVLGLDKKSEQHKGAQFLAGRVQVPSTGTVPDRKGTVPEERRSGDEKKLQPLSDLDFNSELLLVNNLDPRKAEELGIGYRARHSGAGSLMIPIRDEHGELHGYLGAQELTYVPKDFQPPENVVAFKKKA